MQIGGDLGGVGEGGGGGREESVTISAVSHRTVSSEPGLLWALSEAPATHPRGHVSQQGQKQQLVSGVLSFLQHLAASSHKSPFDWSLCASLHPVF